MRRWTCSIATGVVALTLGAAGVHADTITPGHEGGQGADKRQASAGALADPNGARAFTSSGTSALHRHGPSLSQVQAQVRGDATIAIDQSATGASTRSVTRTSSSGRFVTSTTRAVSIAVDEDGDRVLARAFAKARAPTNVAAVRSGAGTITTRTSVNVAGNGAGSARAGGSIGISGGAVKVSTWGGTSAEVF
jgi:hypothetical protein